MVRKGLTPEHYTNHTAGTTAGIAISEWPGHLSHCLDAVRQALVCSADVRYSFDNTSTYVTP